jgi:hypothetical protein
MPRHWNGHQRYPMVRLPAAICLAVLGLAGWPGRHWGQGIPKQRGWAVSEQTGAWVNIFRLFLSVYFNRFVLCHIARMMLCYLYPIMLTSQCLMQSNWAMIITDSRTRVLNSDQVKRMSQNPSSQWLTCGWLSCGIAEVIFLWMPP